MARCVEELASTSAPGQPRKIRDEFVKAGYQSKKGLQARHWKLALQDAAETWDKYWKALFVQVKSKIARNRKLTDEGRHYAYWLLKGYPQFAALMQGREPQPSFHIEENARHQIASYVRRNIKDLKKTSPKVKKARSAKFDSNCYTCIEHNGRQYLKLMSLERGKRLVIPLKGMQKVQGTLTLCLNQDGLKIHVSQQLQPKRHLKTSVEAIDFGYTEVMTDTEGTQYGTQFGQKLTKATNERSQKMQKRHHLHANEKKMRALRPAKAARFRKYNLGRQKLNNVTRRARATLENEINSAINILLKTRNPSILITEDLSHLFKYDKSKNINRKLSAWMRGKLQERIAFKALAEGFRHSQVNPAYGSQTCPHCAFVDHRNRTGDRFKCLHCGHEGQSDRIAALNYARRFDDDEIGLHMPCSQVKIILLGRFHRRLETGQPVTVPGRTLETAAEIYPQKSVETLKKSEPGETISFDRAVNQRAKQNKHNFTCF